jgi:hypothetical protein
MKPILELIVFVAVISILTVLCLIYREARTTQKAVTAFTNDFYYEIEK